MSEVFFMAMSFLFGAFAFLAWLPSGAKWYAPAIPTAASVIFAALVVFT